jgi:hypothetical protein
MDLFNAFAVRELEELHSALTRELSSIESQQRQYKKNKTLVDDLFYPFKKALAFLRQFIDYRSTFKLLADSHCLIKAATLADEQSYKEKDAVRVSLRVVELLEMIRNKIVRMQESSISNTFLTSGLQVQERQFKCWVYSIKNGWI